MAVYGSPGAKKDNRPLFIVLGTVVGVLCLVACCAGLAAASGDRKQQQRPARPSPVRPVPPTTTPPTTEPTTTPTWVRRSA